MFVLLIKTLVGSGPGIISSVQAYMPSQHLNDTVNRLNIFIIDELYNLQYHKSSRGIIWRFVLDGTIRCSGLSQAVLFVRRHGVDHLPPGAAANRT